MVREICKCHHAIAGTIQIGCNGLSALTQCTDADYTVKPTSPYFDLITATRAMLQVYPVEWIPHHVKGHQDDDLTALLDRWATLILRWTTEPKFIGPTLLTSHAHLTARFRGNHGHSGARTKTSV
jgi:hypothetical protein